MAKTWNLVLVEDDGTEISLIGFDAMEIIETVVFNSRLITALKWHIEKTPHYKAQGRVKTLESSTGDKLDVNTVGVIRATAASDDVSMGLFFIKTAKGSLQVLALWDDAFANACKKKKDRYQRFILNIVQVPTFFAKVSIILPKT